MIRTCKLSDIEFLVPLWGDLDSYVAKITNSEILNSRVKDDNEIVFETLSEVINSDKQMLYIAEENDILVGFATAYIERLPWFRPSTGLIGSCWVNENYRNKGIGRALVKQAENWLNVKNVTNIQVCWDKQNALANSFWQNNGYIASQIRGTKKIAV